MSRLCHDCGVADWQDCQCDPRAGLDAPRNPHQRSDRRVAVYAPDHSARVSLQHAIGRAADDLLLGVDPACQPLTDADRVVRLAEYLGDVASDLRVNDCLDLDAMLVQLGAGVQVWLEERAREAAR